MSDAKPSSGSGTIRRFAWIVVNVRDLERSRAFYERFTPLCDRGEFEVTDASVFGVERGSFVAAVMRDDTGTTACPVLLVQWSSPPVTGTTYPSHTNPGYFRICFQHPDAGALFAEVRAAGCEPLSPLRLPKPGRSTGRPVFSVRDPDGTVLEFLTFPGEPRLYHVNCNTADLERAHEFFGDTVGLECAVRSTTTDLEEHSFGPGGDLATYDARLYRADDNPGGAPHLLLDVVESTFPGPVGHAYTSPTNAGIARVGVEVDDLDAPPAATWELGPLLGARRVAVLRSPDDVPFDVVERVVSAPDLETMKSSVRRFLDAMAANDVETLRALLAHDATWWVPPSAAEVVARPLVGIDQVAELAGGAITRAFRPGTTTWQIEHMTADDDRVAILMYRRSVTANGNPYENQYHWLFRFVGDHIAEVWEILDTALARDALA